MKRNDSNAHWLLALRTRIGLTVVCLTLACVLSGCVSTRESKNDLPPVICPPRIQQLANALAIHRARYSSWPPTLDTLIARDLLRGVPAERLTAYGYAAAPLALLPDGRTVMVVDDTVNIDNTVWCIVQTPAAAPRQPIISVIAVPLETLSTLAESG